MTILLLLRHGQSQWNLENRFTGWKDVELSENGIIEAKKTGKLIRESNIQIDKVYTSNLKRAIDTATIAMEEAKYNHLFSEKKLQMIRSQAMNERDYGDLVGLNKKDTSEKYGNEQVHIWRRSFEVRPPGGESLKDVVARMKPYYENNIKKDLIDGKNLLVSAHGNSLRALFIILDFYSSNTISKVEIPTGKPFIVEFEKDKIVKQYYL